MEVHGARAVGELSIYRELVVLFSFIRPVKRSSLGRFASPDSFLPSREIDAKCDKCDALFIVKARVYCVMGGEGGFWTTYQVFFFLHPITI